jgi:hypothetical protein
MSPISAEGELGKPDKSSRKSNPLILQYGPLELTFWSPRTQPPKLTRVSLTIANNLQNLPAALRFEDWTFNSAMRIEDFENFMAKIGVQPEDTLRSREEIVVPSGVRASFQHDQLIALSLSKREADSNRAPILNDDREPSVEQIQAQLRDAHRALDSGLTSGALLLAWAALEAVLRLTALNAGYKGKLRGQPTVLIRELYALGRLNRDDFEHLESVRQLRTAIAHGLASEPVSETAVLRILHVADRLLGRL